MSVVDEGAISHRVSVNRLPQAGMTVILKADADELKRLAKAHDLLEVSAFSAQMLVKKWRGDGVKVTGTVKADIVQNCVVTLEPLNSSLSNDIEAVFVPETSKLARPPVSGEGEIVLDYDGPDLPDTFSGDTIDAGALAEEIFGLAIDPYPRKQGAAFEFEDASASEAEAKPSPFAKLVDFPKR
jgi:uncharacterized metal-binding protein YceD (DUF177 family)